jgi:rhamnosyltransferase
MGTDQEGSLVSADRHVKVALLLATYNGARYVEAQLESLKANTTPITVHWLDDHSTDNTREVVRAVANKLDIDLKECHHPERQGVPGVFFQLLESVTADIYLFCDQDDIWQPGKIDATVASLLPDLSARALSFTDPIVFMDGDTQPLGRFMELQGMRGSAILDESRLFMIGPALGHTIGLTRALRDLYLEHSAIARAHAGAHDYWMYIIATATGTVRMLSDAPTTLYRRHRSNFTVGFNALSAGWWKMITSMWSLQRLLRPIIARQAKGFVLAAPTLPEDPRVTRLVSLANMIAALERRQSPAAVIRLALRRGLTPHLPFALSLAVACMCSDAVGASRPNHPL